MARCSKVVSITSTTSRQDRCSARSPSIRRWCWRISRSTKSPTKSPPCKSCWRNWTWRAISSPATRCIVKKNLRSRRRRERASDRSTQGHQPTLCQTVEAACATAMPLSGVQTVDEKRRNRHETRTIAVFDASPVVVGTEWEPYVAAVIQVERSVHAFQPATGLWKTSLENSFYLSNRARSEEHTS